MQGSQEPGEARQVINSFIATLNVKMDFEGTTFATFWKPPGPKSLL